MVKSVYDKYESHEEFLESVRASLSWRNMLVRLENSTTYETIRDCYKAAEKYIGARTAANFWDFNQHKIDDTVSELWNSDYNVTEAIFKQQVLGMMAWEWLDKNVDKVMKDDIAKEKEVIDELMPFFYNIREEAAEYYDKAKNMENMDIIQLTAKLVKSKVISEVSCRKALWEVLRKHEIYKAGVGNWRDRLRKNL